MNAFQWIRVGLLVFLLVFLIGSAIYDCVFGPMPSDGYEDDCNYD